MYITYNLQSMGDPAFAGSAGSAAAGAVGGPAAAAGVTVPPVPPAAAAPAPPPAGATAADAGGGDGGSNVGISGGALGRDLRGIAAPAENEWNSSGMGIDHSLRQIR